MRGRYSHMTFQRLHTYEENLIFFFISVAFVLVSTSYKKGHSPCPIRSMHLLSSPLFSFFFVYLSISLFCLTFFHEWRYSICPSNFSLFFHHFILICILNLLFYLLSHLLFIPSCSNSISISIYLSTRAAFLDKLDIFSLAFFFKLNLYQYHISNCFIFFRTGSLLAFTTLGIHFALTQYVWVSAYIGSHFFSLRCGSEEADFGAALGLVCLSL